MDALWCTSFKACVPHNPCVCNNGFWCQNPPNLCKLVLFISGPDGVAYRALFIIDKDGMVQHATVNNMAFGRNVDEVLRVLDALQYTQENPDEVCPAGWQPGDKTMRPDFDGKREYFQDER